MRIKAFIKNNIIGFIIGAILFAGMGYAVATGITSSTVEYTTTNNANIETVEDALDDLYVKASRLNSLVDPKSINTDGIGGKLSFVFWNDNFNNSTYSKTTVPTGTGLSGTYATRAALATAYGSSNFANRPIYIKSTKVNGSTVGHVACLWYNNNEFCIAPNYWVETGNGGSSHQSTENGLATKAKLKADMEAALGITIADSSCNSYSSGANCFTGDFFCSVRSFGDVACNLYVTGTIGCYVAGNGGASCLES